MPSMVTVIVYGMIGFQVFTKVNLMTHLFDKPVRFEGPIRN